MFERFSFDRQCVSINILNKTVYSFMPSFPFILQPGAMDCGPTCLRMIAEFYGKKYSIEYLRRKTQIGKEGVNLVGISEAAEAIGFRTTARRMSYERLANE